MNEGTHARSINNNATRENRVPEKWGPFVVIILEKWDTLLEIIGSITRSIITIAGGSMRTHKKQD